MRTRPAGFRKANYGKATTVLLCRCSYVRRLRRLWYPAGSGIPYCDAYTWMPWDGIFFSPFGWGFYSPGFGLCGSVLWPRRLPRRAP